MNHEKQSTHYYIIKKWGLSISHCIGLDFKYCTNQYVTTLFQCQSTCYPVSILRKSNATTTRNDVDKNIIKTSGGRTLGWLASRLI